MRYLFLLTPIFLMVASGCKKNRNRNFPNVRFEEYVYLNNASSYNLTTPGGWIYHSGGYRGLIIVRRDLGNSPGSYGAYDRTCPEHYSRDCSVLEVEENNIYARCSCNGEKYVIYDGSPSDGAEQGLFEYPVDINGSVLYIAN